MVVLHTYSRLCPQFCISALWRPNPTESESGFGRSRDFEYIIRTCSCKWILHVNVCRAFLNPFRILRLRVLSITAVGIYSCGAVLSNYRICRLHSHRHTRDASQTQISVYSNSTAVTLFPHRGFRMAPPLAVGPVRRLPTPPSRSPGSAPWLPGFV